MISASAIAQLASHLARLRNGGDDIEVVRWLRDLAPGIASCERPQPQDPARGYSRSLLHRGEGFEIVAIHWDANIATPIHDHGGALCWLAIADGVMHVDNFRRLDAGTDEGYARIELEGREELPLGGVDYRQDDVHLHRCITSGLSATSLHVYAHPIESFLTFDERTNTCAPCVSSYDAMLV